MNSDSYTNILLLLPDQHRRDWTGHNASLDLNTPSLDALARRGVRFTRAYTPSPLCAPARACLASGLGYRECGVPSNGENYPADQPTYYQRLRDTGYRVGGVGKFDLHKATLDWSLDGSRLIDEWGFTDGIDNEGKLDGSISYGRNNGPMGPYMNFLQEQGLAEAYVDEHARRKDHQDAYTTVLPDGAYCDNWVAENGLRVLDGFPTDSPWHLVVNFAGPHNPMDITESMRNSVASRSFPEPYGPTGSTGSYKSGSSGYTPEDHQRNRQNYAAMVENIDRQVGRFLDLIESRGETDRTLVVYSSDHGEMLGDHNRWGKSTWQEPSVGIPLIVSPPPAMNLQGDRCSDAIVSLHDLASTFIEIAGAKPLPYDDSASASQSILPVLREEQDTHRAVGTSALDSQANRPSGLAWRIVTDSRYKLVELTGEIPDNEEQHRFMLFDLIEDPRELTDLSTAKPDTVAKLRPLLP